MFRGLKRFPYGVEKWYVGDLWHMRDGSTMINTNIGSLTVESNTVGQSLGRKDKADTPVFEGDIARYEHITQDGKLEIGDPFEIRWNENEVAFCAWDGYTFVALPPFDRLRVIGNIHQPDTIRKEAQNE